MTLAATVLIVAGLVFYAAGTIGLLRFPDVHARLHALTKADNLGLGFIAAGAALLLGDGWSATRLLLVWLLTMLSAATVAQLIARAARRQTP